MQRPNSYHNARYYHPQAGGPRLNNYVSTEYQTTGNVDNSYFLPATSTPMPEGPMTNHPRNSPSHLPPSSYPFHALDYDAAPVYGRGAASGQSNTMSTMVGNGNNTHDYYSAQAETSADANPPMHPHPNVQRQMMYGHHGAHNNSTQRFNASSSSGNLGSSPGRHGYGRHGGHHGYQQHQGNYHGNNWGHYSHHYSPGSASASTPSYGTQNNNYHNTAGATGGSTGYSGTHHYNNRYNASACSTNNASRGSSSRSNNRSHGQTGVLNRLHVPPLDIRKAHQGGAGRHRRGGHHAATSSAQSSHMVTQEVEIEDITPHGDGPEEKEAQTPKERKECAAYCGEDSQHGFVKLPCNHELHRGCLETLLGQRIGRCPICRGSLDSLRRGWHYFKIAEELDKEFVGDFRAARLNSLKLVLDEEKEVPNTLCPEKVKDLMDITGCDQATVIKSLNHTHGNSEEAATMLMDLLELQDVDDDE